MDTATQTTLGQVALALITLAGFGLQMWKESMNRKADADKEARNRQWDLEDRERARKELEMKVTEAQQTAVVANEAVIQKIDENTEISRNAFKEANNTNQKLLELAHAIDQTYERRAVNLRRRADDPPQIDETP
jgi:hypothetical protein